VRDPPETGLRQAPRMGAHVGGVGVGFAWTARAAAESTLARGAGESSGTGEVEADRGVGGARPRHRL